MSQPRSPWTLLSAALAGLGVGLFAIALAGRFVGGPLPDTTRSLRFLELAAAAAFLLLLSLRAREP